MQLLSDIIGQELTMKIIAELGGVSLYIPRPDYTVIRYFHERLGGDPKKTAQTLGVSQRTVFRAIAQAKEEDAQLSIFDELAKIQANDNIQVAVS